MPKAQTQKRVKALSAQRYEPVASAKKRTKRPGKLHKTKNEEARIMLDGQVQDLYAVNQKGVRQLAVQPEVSIHDLADTLKNL